MQFNSSGYKNCVYYQSGKKSTNEFLTQLPGYTVIMSKANQPLIKNDKGSKNEMKTMERMKLSFL